MRTKFLKRFVPTDSEKRSALSQQKRGKFLISELTLRPTTLPEAFQKFRIVFVTDFHYGIATPFSHLEEAWRIIADLNPNLLLCGGDLVQRTRHGLDAKLAKAVGRKYSRYKKKVHSEVRDLASNLTTLFNTYQPADGIYSVYGNHDYGEGVGIISEQLTPPVNWLKNSRVQILKENSSLEIAGLDDIQKGRPDFSNLVESTTSAFARILLCHNPDVVKRDHSETLKNFDLVLCGHTHGGQICLPVIGPVVSRTKQRKHISGLSLHGNTPIFVSNGIGFGVVQLRMLCPPEIVVISFAVD